MTSRQANSVAAGPADAVGQEQAYVDMLYRLLDQARERAERALARTQGSGTAGGTFQARVERDVTAAEQGRRLAQLNAVERGLVFGRTDGGQAPGDDAAPDTLYIGRIGLRDDEHEPRLIDWRAPAAHPFYAATPKDPNGLIRRRHIYTRDRTVTGVDDEVFDLDRLSEPDRQSLSGEAMLIASITSGAHRPDDRRGRHHPGRAGPGDPGQPAGRPGRAGRPGHRQDGRGPAPRRVPAVHPPADPRAPRRPGHRPERHLPPLHQPGPAVPGRDRRGAHLDGRAVPRRQRRARRRSGRRRDQGQPEDGDRAAPGGARPPAGPAR